MKKYFAMIVMAIALVACTNARDRVVSLFEGWIRNCESDLNVVTSNEGELSKFTVVCKMPKVK